MEKLPFELKQRVCSFLQADPKLLKPIRLVSKQFADAAAPYLLPHIFLVKHRDSCAEVREIADHAIFSKHITTLIVDPSNLKNHKSFQKRVAVKKVTKALRKSQEHYWKAQRQIAAYQSTEEFRRCLDTIAYAFKVCPNLVNIVIAPPQPGQNHVILKLLSMFKSIHPHPDAWVDAELHDPFEFGLAEVLSAADHKNAGLNSLTIINLPFKCADYTEVDSFKSFKHLKHVRIGYNRLPNNPEAMFGFNLEEAIGKANVLETIWIEMPPHARDVFNGDATLHALNSKFLRDVILGNIAVTENALVNFLLRHTQSLQQFDICGLTLSAGSWTSTFKRISCQMTSLKRVQIVEIFEMEAGQKVSPYTFKWWSEAPEFILNGGVLPDPLPSDKDEDEDDKDYEFSVRQLDLPEEGLWKDYDNNMNFGI